MRDFISKQSKIQSITITSLFQKRLKTSQRPTKTNQAKEKTKVSADCTRPKKKKPVAALGQKTSSCTRITSLFQKRLKTS
jgi:hypothetical protein